MKLVDAFISAIESLLSDKLRSFLSILGTIIGISAIVLIQILGVSVANSMSDLIVGKDEQIKADFIVVPSKNNKNVKIDNIGSYIIPNEAMLTDQFLQNLEEKFNDEGMQRIYSSNYTNINIIRNDEKEHKLSIEGCTQAYLDDMFIELTQGVMFDDLSKDDKEVAIVPERFLKEICNGEDYLNKVWNCFDGNKFLSFRIVGVYKEDVYEIKMEDMLKMYIPMDYMKLQGGITEEKFDTMGYRIKNVTDIEKMREEIIKYYNQSYNIDDWTLDVKFDIDQRKTINKFMQFAVRIVTVIGALTFVIGAMCIINMMVIIMDEKLTEVGIRRALGAKKKDVYIEILIEAIILVLFGVIIGAVLGCVGGYFILLIISQMGESLIDINYFVIPWEIIIKSILVSFVVGIMAATGPIIKVKDFTICEILNHE